MDMRPSRDAARRAAVPGIAGAATLVATLCAIYVVSQFLRNSVGVIAPDIAAELALSPEALGILSSIFFFSFAASQIPLGVAIDRFGPKRCMLASAGLAICGCLVFAASDSLPGLIAARVLMGIGCSSFFMGPLTIYTRWFSPHRFSTLTGIQLGLGTLGTLFATAPLAFSTALFGWRATFVFVALATAIFGMLVALVVRDDPPGRPPAARSAATLGASIAGLVAIVRVPGFAQVFVMQLLAYSSLVTILGLWGGPFLADVHGFDLTERGNILFLMAGANVLGSFLWGPMDRLFAGRRLPVSIGVIATAILLVALALFGGGGSGPVIAILVALGFSGAYVPVLTAHGRGLFSPQDVGRGMTTINLATIGGVFVLQAVTGGIIGLFEPAGAAGAGARPFAAYQAAFVFLASALICAWAYYRTAPDLKPGQEAAG